MKKKAVFIYADAYLSYHFNEEHPFNQKRVLLTKELLEFSNSLSEEDIIPPRLASEEEIALFHDEDYIEAVKRAGEGKLSIEKGLQFGLGTDDTPIFPNMHEASSMIVGLLNGG